MPYNTPINKNLAQPVGQPGRIYIYRFRKVTAGLIHELSSKDILGKDWRVQDRWVYKFSIKLQKILQESDNFRLKLASLFRKEPI